MVPHQYQADIQCSALGFFVNILCLSDQGSQQSSQPWWRIKLFVWEPVLFGTWDGVFTTCMINIFGVVLFLRTGYLVVGIQFTTCCVADKVFVLLVSPTAVLSAPLISIFSCIYHWTSTIEKPCVFIAVVHTLPFSFACPVELNLVAVPLTGPPVLFFLVPVCQNVINMRFLWLRVFLELVSWTVCCTFSFYLHLHKKHAPFQTFVTCVRVRTELDRSTTHCKVKDKGIKQTLSGDFFFFSLCRDSGKYRRAPWDVPGVFGCGGGFGNGDVRNRSVWTLWRRERRNLLHDLHRPGQQGGGHCGSPLCIRTGELWFLLLPQRDWKHNPAAVPTLQCVAGAMYITGFSESVAEVLGLQGQWVVRGLSAVVLLALLGINLAGVKWIVRLQLLLLAVLAISTLDFVVGTFTHLDPGGPSSICNS